MKRFIFFTKTDWHETPRIRHQLAWLLRDAGYSVVFFEKPRSSWGRVKESVVSTEDAVRLCRYTELCHHKLRVSQTLQDLNASWVLRSIQPFVELLDLVDDDIIVNFNYDYGFLRKLFKRNCIITIINDNFVSQALLGWQKPVNNALEMTCRTSNHVLAVSNPLLAQLAPFCDPQLFLPWADCAYRSPSPDSMRDTFLFWGYINDRIDYECIFRWADSLARRKSHLRFLFVGPLNIGRYERQMLFRQPNISIEPPSRLDDLPLERVVAGIIPYKADVPRMDAITLSNKALQLLARGLPLIIHGMPDFQEAPFIVRLDGADCVDVGDYAVAKFSFFQPHIRAFVSEHSAEARLKQFLNLAA